MTSAISRTPNGIWSWPDSLDALLAAPAHHTLLLENEKMRVVQTRIPPGQTVPAHTHRLAGVLFIQNWSDLIRRDQHGTVLLDTRQWVTQSQHTAMARAVAAPHGRERRRSGV